MYKKTRTKRRTKNVYKNAYKKRVQKTRTRVHTYTRPRAPATAPRVGNGRSAPTPRFKGSTHVIRWTCGRWMGLSYYTQEPVL